MRGLKVPKRHGEKVRKALVEQGLLLPGYKVFRDEQYIYFPVKESIPGYDTVDTLFEEKRKHPESLQRFGLRSFDIIGDIAVIDIAEGKDIVNDLLSRKPIRTVVQRAPVNGEVRTRVCKHLGGDQKSETIHTEYGLKFKVDINKVYFNPRLSTERMRVAQKVKPGEVVCDMFCGVGPFSLMIAKYSEAETICAIDMNPEAIALLKENIHLNNITNVVPVLGDAKIKIKMGNFDRIIMNLPHESFSFLPEALQHGSIIHYYRITADVQGEIQRIRQLGDIMDIPLTIAHYRTVKSYSPDMDLYRIDIFV